MTRPRPPVAFPVRPTDRTATPDPVPSPQGLDGVMGDVLVTVLLAAVLAALVGAVIVLLWRVLPSASRIAALSFATVVPPPRRHPVADARDGVAVRAVLLRLASAVAIPMVAIGMAFAFWSRDDIAAPAAILVGLVLVVAELELLGSESWRRTRRAWRRR